MLARDPGNMSSEWAHLVLEVVNLELQALNILHGRRCLETSLAKNAPGRALQSRALMKAHRLKRMVGIADLPSGEFALAELVGDSMATRIQPTVPLTASSCDLLPKSGQVDPLWHVDASVAEFLTEPCIFFEAVAPGTIIAGRMLLQDRAEYARLIVAELRSGRTVMGMS